MDAWLDPYKVTVARAANGARAAKTWREDGINPYPGSLGWKFDKRDVSTLARLFDLLKELERDGGAILRGKANVQRGRRLSSAANGDARTIESAARRWLCFDFDKPLPIKLEDDRQTFREALETAVRGRLWECAGGPDGLPGLSRPSLVVQLSSSSGYPGKGVKVHVWILTDRALDNDEARAIYERAGADPSMARPGQLHYCAAPTIAEGAPADPFPERTFLFEGKFERWSPPANITAETRETMQPGAPKPVQWADEQSPAHDEAADFLEGPDSPYGRGDAATREQWLALPKSMAEAGFTEECARDVWDAIYEGDDRQTDEREAWGFKIANIGAGSLVRLLRQAGYGRVDELVRAWRGGEVPASEFKDERQLSRRVTEDGPLRFLTAQELAGIREPSYLVKDWLFEEQFSVICGQPGAGKTFFAFDLAFHIALGRPWFGRRVRPGVVIYIALEGIGGVRKRAEAWCKCHGVDLASVPIVFASGTMNLRGDHTLRRQIADKAEAARKRFGLPVQIIFIDTLARAMNGGDENAPKDMGELIAGADLLRNSTRAHVCLVHHEGKDSAKGMRGHSSLLGAVDTVIAVAANKENAKLSAAHLTKQKDGELGKFQQFALESVALDRCDEDGDEIKSAAVVATNDSLVFEDTRLNERQRAGLRVLLDILRGRFPAEEDDRSTRVWIRFSEWEGALVSAGWPDGAKPDLKCRQTRGGQARRPGNDDSGRKADAARTKDSFDRAFRRLREDLEEKGIIEFREQMVAFVESASGQEADKSRTSAE